MDYREAWSRYCSVKDWHQAGKHVEWACEQDGDTLIVYFQGSYETIDWIRDLQAWPSRWMILHNDTNILVHHGFKTMMYDLLSDDDFCNEVERIEGGNIELIGYSSGAALAALFSNNFTDLHIALASTDFNKSTSKISACYLFACPQLSWLHPLDTLCEDVTLVRLDKDSVPKVLGLFGYRKVKGKEIVLKSRASVFKSHLPASYTEVISEAKE